MSLERVYRVTARSRFKNLSEQARSSLLKAQPDHDIFKSAFTAEGTFTYDEKVLFFNLRYEVAHLKVLKPRVSLRKRKLNCS